MTKSQRPQVFIEKIMPVKLLNQQVYYEHGGNPFKGLHRWYSRKPLSFSRASVLASLLPADISMEEFEYLLGLHPEKDGILLKKKEPIKLYKTPPTNRIIEKLEEHCDKVWGKRKPVVLDAFAGGGSIPFEAARYGLNQSESRNSCHRQKRQTIRQKKKIILNVQLHKPILYLIK